MESDLDKIARVLAEHGDDIRWLREQFRNVQRYLGATSESVPPGWCWLKEVTRFGFREEVIRRRIHKGEISGERIGGRWIVKIAEVEALAHKKDEKRSTRRAA